MWEDLELDPERIPLFKLIFHSLQILFAFVLWALEIAVFRDKEAKIVGNNGWTFGVFFLSVPAWIYLMMAPRSPRVRKMAEPHAMLVVDAIFTIIWLSAFATQAAYNTANQCGTACGLSKAIVALGVLVFLCFCVTTFFSIWTLKYYQWNNRLPGYDRGQHDQQNIDPDKAAFSLAPHDEEYAPVNMSDHEHDSHIPPHHDDDLHYHGAGSVIGGPPAAAPRSDYSDPYSSTVGGSQVGGGGVSQVGGVNQMGRHGTVHSAYHDNPFREHENAGANPFDSDSEYHAGGGRVSAMGNGSSMGSRYAAPTATDVYDDHLHHADPVTFPTANYDRIER